jgi:cob(I)alamin adenosyltransferase
MPPLDQGLVQVYTGDGKGKTTAALGLAIRAIGHHLRVCFIQFAKSNRDKGEGRSVGRFAPDLETQSFAAAHWGDPGKAPPGTPWWLLPPSDEDRSKAQEGLVFALRSLTGGDYDVVILDEILAALAHGLVSLEQVMELIAAKPPTVELVLTGRNAPAEIIDAADLVTEMRAVKHPFERGIPARRGIEY